MTVAELLGGHRVVVCVGTGGVGKTTVSAALALAGAKMGLRSVVLTIDPARRLAQALGVDALGLDASTVELEDASAGGSLDAAMLDQKAAWDAFIRRHAPSPSAATTILENSFYRRLSASFAGSTEYMAMEELGRLYDSGRYDLIVLDTPPTGHALDFLTAPRRLRAFLERNTVASLAAPYLSAGWSAWKSASRGLRSLIARIEEAAGTRTLTDVAEFFVAMEGVFDAVAARSKAVEQLLAGPQTAFVLVAGPEERLIDEADELIARAEALQVRVSLAFLNRVTAPYRSLADDEEALDALRAGGSDLSSQSREWLVAACRRQRLRAEANERAAQTLAARLPGNVEVVSIEDSGEEMTNVAALATLSKPWLVSGSVS